MVEIPRVERHLGVVVLEDDGSDELRPHEEAANATLVAPEEVGPLRWGDCGYDDQVSFRSQVVSVTGAEAVVENVDLVEAGGVHHSDFESIASLVVVLHETRDCPAQLLHVTAQSLVHTCVQ